MAPLFRDKICAVVAAPTAREMQAQLRRALKLTRTVELRLDYLRPGEVVPFLDWFDRQRTEYCTIATLRRRAAGGWFRGSLARQLSALAAAWASGATWCDIESESFAGAGLLWRDVLRAAGAQLLVSYHDFQRTPAGLAGIERRLQRQHCHAVKIAARCHSYREAVRMLELCRRKRNVIAVPMGEIGLPARVLALKHGSALAYAAVGERTAPGQLTIDEMKSLYRADKLDRHTKVYGVIGNPVSHSLSPQMHNAGFQGRHINAVYLPFLVNDLRDFVAAIRPLDIAGFSVTLPWKERILEYLDECDPLAAKIGAVNTVTVRGRKLYGTNTD